jgi:predicted enzyme related to lactoylglutathione lyase
MPKTDKHTTGTFCWVELGTTDQTSAKSFYSSLFGWTPADSSIGPNEYYTIFKLNDSDAAAAYTMRPEERSMTPPHWNLYIAVDSADDTAKHSGDLGGKVIAPPFDVMTLGRMAVIQDPTGAVFCVWQPKDHPGTRVKGESGTLCWADLSTPDSGRAKQFYESLFGWKVGAAEQYPPDYLVIKNGEELIGGIQPAAYWNPNAPPHWMLFFLVGDVDGLAAKAKGLGGAEHLAPMSVGGARLSVLADPQGAAFSILQPPPQDGATSVESHS